MNINNIFCPGCSEEIPATTIRGLPLWDRLRLRLRQEPPPPQSKVRGDCWIWMGGKSGNENNLYGAIQQKGSVLKTHRVTYEMFRGSIPEDLVVDHVCQVKLCCNPNHLEAVTDAENARRRDKREYTVPVLDDVELPDLRAAFDFPDLPSVCCRNCQTMIPGAPSAHLPLEDRILLRTVRRPAPKEANVEGDCWVWIGSSSGRGRSRYGTIMIGSLATKTHRATYELWKDPIPEGFVLDHLCRITLCCNPDHLEPVTQQENVLRGVGVPALNSTKTQCKMGHEFNEENTYLRPGGGRACRACKMTRIQEKRDEGYLKDGTVPPGVYGEMFLERVANRRQ